MKFTLEQWVFLRQVLREERDRLSDELWKEKGKYTQVTDRGDTVLKLRKVDELLDKLTEEEI